MAVFTVALVMLLWLVPRMCLADNPEVAVLRAFQKGISSDVNNELSNWVDDVPICQWHHVTCNNDGHVTDIIFNYVEVVGTLAPELGNLKHLVHLAVQHSNFTGPIPASLSQIPTLKTLHLKNNKFSGAIPPSLCGLSELKIDLSNNDLYGRIPECAVFARTPTWNFAGNPRLCGKQVGRQCTA